MAFESFSEFMCMQSNGYCHGTFVWAAYAIGAAVIIFNLVSPVLLRKRLIADQARRERREQA
jgi:heme exporter protein D